MSVVGLARRVLPTDTPTTENGRTPPREGGRSLAPPSRQRPDPEPMIRLLGLSRVGPLQQPRLQSVERRFDERREIGERLLRAQRAGERGREGGGVGRAGGGRLPKRVIRAEQAHPRG